MKKIKEENVEADFSSSGKAGSCGAPVARRGECSVCTSGATLASTVAPARMVPRGMQWCTEARGNASHSAPATRSSVGTVAPAEQAPHGAQRHAGTSASTRSAQPRRVL